MSNTFHEEHYLQKKHLILLFRTYCKIQINNSLHLQITLKLSKRVRTNDQCILTTICNNLALLGTVMFKFLND
jgi:hypothetical protein